MKCNHLHTVWSNGQRPFVVGAARVVRVQRADGVHFAAEHYTHGADAKVARTATRHENEFDAKDWLRSRGVEVSS